ncbi:MAG: PIN domain nuclease [Thermodesulfobacteriota bacterium]
MILVDSSVWINYFNGIDTWQTELLDQLLKDVPILIGDLILVEVLQGLKGDKDFSKAKEALSILPFCQVGGYEVALLSARNYRKLRKRGITVRKTIDVIIGSYCILKKLPLLHDDRDFEPMVEHLSLKAIPKGFSQSS